MGFFRIFFPFVFLRGVFWFVCLGLFVWGFFGWGGRGLGFGGVFFVEKSKPDLRL